MVCLAPPDVKLKKDQISYEGAERNLQSTPFAKSKTVRDKSHCLIKSTSHSKLWDKKPQLLWKYCVHACSMLFCL